MFLRVQILVPAVLVVLLLLAPGGVAPLSVAGTPAGTPRTVPLGPEPVSGGIPTEIPRVATGGGPTTDAPRASARAETAAASPGLPVFQPRSIALGALGSEPIAAYYDPTNQVVYVEDTPTIVIEVSATTGHRIATVAISNSSAAAVPPTSLAFDPAANELWVLGPGALEVSALALSNNSIVRSVTMPESCGTVGGLAFDPVTGAVWVACAGAVFAFSATTGTRLFAQNVSYSSGSIAYDPVSGTILVSVWFAVTGTDFGFSVFDPLNYSRIQNVSTGTNRSGGFATGGIVYDAGTQQLAFTADLPGSKWGVGVVNASTYSGIGFGVVPGHPDGLAAGNSSTPYVYLALYGSDKLGQFDLSNFHLAASIPVNGTPGPIAYDSADDVVDVVTIDTAQLFYVPAASLSIQTVVPVGGAPSAIAYDNATNSLWVANSNNVSVVSDRTHSVEATLPSSFGPEAIVIDSTDERAFVATYDDQNVTVFNATSYRVVAVVTVAPNPLGMLIDPTTGNLYVSSLNGTHGQVDVISGTTYRILARLTVGDAPSNLAYDPVSGQIVVANEFSSNLSLISPSSMRVVGNVSLSGFYPWGITFDPEDQELFLSDANLEFNLVTGNESSQIDALLASNYTVVGSVTVDPVTFGIAYSPAANLIFAASYIFDVVDVVNPLTLTWNATIPVGENPVAVVYDPGTSEVYIANSGSSNLSYLLPPPTAYSVTFTERGLAGGEWRVTVGTTTATAPVGSPIVFALPNGSFAYQIAALAGYTTNWTGTVSVDGAAQSLVIAFVRVTYPVTFTEVGLPSGTDWSVTFDGHTETGPGNLTFAQIPNGTIPFSVGAIAGYTVLPSSGAISINGLAVVESVTFHHTPTFLGLSTDEGYGVLGALVVAILLVAAAAVLWRRRLNQAPPPREPTRRPEEDTKATRPPQPPSS